MDFAIVMQKIGEFFIYFCSKEFTFAGYTTTIGSFIVWLFIATIIIGILKGLAD